MGSNHIRAQLRYRSDGHKFPALSGAHGNEHLKCKLWTFFISTSRGKSSATAVQDHVTFSSPPVRRWWCVPAGRHDDHVNLQLRPTMMQISECTLPSSRLPMLLGVCWLSHFRSMDMMMMFVPPDAPRSYVAKSNFRLFPASFISVPFTLHAKEIHRIFLSQRKISTQLDEFLLFLAFTVRVSVGLRLLRNR